MKRLAFAAASFAVMFVLRAGDVVTGVTLTQDADTKLVRIGYSLTRDAVVTFAIEADGVSVERKLLAEVLGDVNRRVAATGAGETREILWKPTSGWMPAANPGTFKAVVRAWPDSSPPEWLVCDLRTMRTSYYETEDEMPYGNVTNSFYKSAALAMRKMHAAGVTWWMGNPASTGTGASPYRKVRFTRDYYISVYLTTVGQGDLMNGGTDSSDSARRRMPTSYVTVADMNGTYLPHYRANTGLDLALPTSAQWEYACRAGTAETRFCPDGELGDYAWIPANSGNESHEVGTRKPNPWGLYDMLGNMNEYVSDYYSATLSSSSMAEDDPTGPVSGDKWVYRGGSYMDSAGTATSYFAGGYSSKTTSLGFRLVITLPQADL